jgi:4-amino-4-deoxy-L-arabinose transferase-like glycosyltransferase
MMDAPLSAAVIFAAIASFELFWREHIGWKRLIWTAVLWTSFALATASKGVAGLGVWGGALMSVACALLFSRRNAGRLGFSFGLTIASVNFALAPMFFWAYKIWERGDSMSLVFKYFKDQVLKSFLSNRGEAFHPEMGDKLFYIKLLATQAAPYFFGFVIAFGIYVVASFVGRSAPFLERMNDVLRRSWAWVAFSFILAFVVPFSLSTYQLNHYVQPILPLMVSVAVAFFVMLLPQFLNEFLFERAPFRWALFAVAGVGLMLLNRGVSKTPQRGQEFIAVQERVPFSYPGFSFSILVAIS